MKNNQSGNAAVGAIIAIPILIVLFFVFCFRTVGAGKVGIITQFGDVDRQASPGVVVKLPWPIERLHKLDIKIQKQEQDAASATADLQDVSAKLAVNYAINPERAGDVFKTIGKDYHDRVVSPAVQESFKAATTQYTASDLLTRRAEVKQKIVEVIKKRVEPYGIRIDDVSIVNFTFSPEFTRAIEAKQVAAQAAEKAKYDTQKLEQEAIGHVAAAKGQAEAQRLIRETITPEVLQKQAIDKWDGKMPQYIGGGAIFNIPLTR